MPDLREMRSSSRGARPLLWAERALVAAGIGALAWCAVSVAEAVIAQRIARDSLDAAAMVEKPAWEAAAGVAAAVDVAPAGPPARGSAIARLSIPRLDVSVVVLQGSDAQTLRRGPGHLENTALAGQDGNMVVAGHRDSFFWPLQNIRLGDDVFVEASEGRFRYRVEAVRIVNPRDISVLDATEAPVLTLITCYPFWVFGAAPDRFVVRATLVSRPARTTRPRRIVARAVTEAGPANASPRQSSARSDAHVVNDDAVLVRLAVERYRHMYNAQVAGSSQSGVELSTFDHCGIEVSGDTATAVCASEQLPPSGTSGRTFWLQRAAGGWAIKSVVVR
jgi:sortase A